MRVESRGNWETDIYISSSVNRKMLGDSIQWDKEKGIVQTEIILQGNLE